MQPLAAAVGVGAEAEPSMTLVNQCWCLSTRQWQDSQQVRELRADKRE